MKKLLRIFIAAAFALAILSSITSYRLAQRQAAKLAQQQAAWQIERNELETALAEARSARPRVVAVPGAPSAAAAPAPAVNASPAEIIARLRTFKVTPANRFQTLREVIHGLQELVAAGPESLPAIREFLAQNEDVDFESVGRGIVPEEFIVPPSLRFGLFDVLKQIGGAEVEKTLAETLTSTRRGVELSWLARTLQGMAPNKYRDVAVAAAHNLLGRAPVANPTSPLDRNDRENLFNVLSLFGDSSYAATAQTQLLRADGQVDRSALKYWQQALGLQAVPIAAQMYDDPRLTDPAKKEPFARVALNYVGVDGQANEFYQRAINDMSLPKDDRRNLIEDLNQDGFADRKNPSARDLQLIQNRLALIEQLAPSATDPINVAAFQEAYKDLLKMRERFTRPPTATQ